MNEQVILVDSCDREKGVMDKQQAHISGALHRALSVFIFNSKGELLLQRRAMGKYHSSGLWTNTCCSHPRPGEIVSQAASRRLKEEMGLDGNPSFCFSFIYMLPVGDNLFEHELDHVFIGKSDADPSPNESEVMEWKWADTETVKKDMLANPGNYSVWFQLVFTEVVKRANAA
jgi:isopentenyl-diphosphate Delta-isomerase